MSTIRSLFQPRPRPPGEQGAQKSVAAAIPNVAAAILVLVHAATGYFGIGDMPSGVAIQSAVGLLVLAWIGKRLTWYVPNEPAQGATITKGRTNA
jgi:hypothetical protein